jgi:hypothetical protein
VDLDPELVGSLLDAVPRLVLFLLADALDLVKAGDRIADVAGVLERFLALLRDGEGALGQIVTLFFVEFGHSWSPSVETTNRSGSRSMN